MSPDSEDQAPSTEARERRRGEPWLPYPPGLSLRLQGRWHRLSQQVHRHCSPAYLWMRTHYPTLQLRMAVRWPPYAELAAELTTAGIMGGHGRPLTENAARNIWTRVKRDEADAALLRRTRDLANRARRPTGKARAS